MSPVYNRPSLALLHHIANEQIKYKVRLSQTDNKYNLLAFTDITSPHDSGNKQYFFL